MQMTYIEKSYKKRATSEHSVLLACVMIIELRLSAETRGDTSARSKVWYIERAAKPWLVGLSARQELQEFSSSPKAEVANTRRATRSLGCCKLGSGVDQTNQLRGEAFGVALAYAEINFVRITGSPSPPGTLRFQLIHS